MSAKDTIVNVSYLAGSPTEENLRWELAEARREIVKLKLDIARMNENYEALVNELIDAQDQIDSLHRELEP